MLEEIFIKPGVVPYVYEHLQRYCLVSGLFLKVVDDNDADDDYYVLHLVLLSMLLLLLLSVTIVRAKVIVKKT